MEKQFNKILNVAGEEKVFPIDKTAYALFFSEDRNFFIYALYTKEDLTAPELIEIDFDSYMSLRSEDTVENFVKDLDELAVLLARVKRDTILENLSVRQVLEISEKQ